MKRHPSLVPLSREHHDGLVMAQRLILGRSTNRRAAWPREPDAQVERLLAFYRLDLERHFDFEEAELFPMLTARVARSERRWRRIIADLVADHGAMRAMVLDLEHEPTGRLDVRLPAFGARLRAHIQREERELFERMQDECTGPELAELGARVASYAAGPGSACRR